VSDTKFDPNGTMTRAMFVTVLGRLAGIDATATSSSFDDVADGLWYTPYVDWAAQNGITSGKGNNKFDPNGEITRQEMAVMLLRYAKLQNIALKTGEKIDFADSADMADWATEAIDAMSAAGLLNGVGDNKYAPTGNANRASVATLLMRFATDYNL